MACKIQLKTCNRYKNEEEVVSILHVCICIYSTSSFQPSFSIISFFSFCAIFVKYASFIDKCFHVVTGNSPFLPALWVSSRHFRDNVVRRRTTEIPSAHQSHIRRLRSGIRTSVLDIPRSAPTNFEPAPETWKRRMVTNSRGSDVLACVGIVWGHIFVFCLPAFLAVF